LKVKNNYPCSTALSHDTSDVTSTFDPSSTVEELLIVSLNKQAILDDPLAFRNKHGFPIADRWECYSYLGETGGLEVWTLLEMGCVCDLTCTWYRPLTKEEAEWKYLRNEIVLRIFPDKDKVSKFSHYIVLYLVVALLAIIGNPAKFFVV
jgi:hypothetical protein